MSIELSVLAPHVASIFDEEQAPEYQQKLIASMKQVSRQVCELNPDVIVLVSCHWESAFSHFVDCTPVHKGILTGFEEPDLIHDVPYNYPGDQDLAYKLVRAGQVAGIPVQGVNDPYFVWDSGTLVPLRYLVPNGDISVINLSVTLAADLEETYKWGQIIASVIRENGKKAVFISSGSLSHNIVRGRQNMPTLSEQAMNSQFLQLLMKKEYEVAFDMLPQYASLAKVESGGRHLAMLLAVIEPGSEPVYLAEGKSSASWNAVVTFSKTISSHVTLAAESEYVK